MLNIGDTAPDFELLNQDGQPVRLSDFRGRPVVVFTFAKAGTMGCTAQACGLRDQFPRLNEAGVVVLGVSTDSPEDLRRWKERQNLPYDLLSDPDHRVLEVWGAFGVGVLFVKLPVGMHSVWLIDEQGVVFDRQVPVGLGQAANRALDMLARLPQRM